MCSTGKRHHEFRYECISLYDCISLYYHCMHVFNCMNVNIGSASSQYTQREIDLIGSDSDCEIETMRKINVYEDLKNSLHSSDSEPDAHSQNCVGKSSSLHSKARGRPRLTDEEKAAKKAGRNETKEQKIAAKDMKKKLVDEEKKQRRLANSVLSQERKQGKEKSNTESKERKVARAAKAPKTVTNCEVSLLIL